MAKKLLGVSVLLVMLSLFVVPTIAWAHQTVQIQHAVDTVELKPAAVVARTEGIVDGVGNRLDAGGADMANGSRSEEKRLVEPDNLGLCLVHQFQQ